MKFFLHLAVLLAAITLVSCKKGQITDPEPATTNWEPTEAQPKLPTMKIYVGPETLDAELALSEREMQTGMMFRTNIQDSDSMLFVFPTAQRVGFWMKNCPESISCVYINTDGFIEEVHHLEKNDTNAVLSATDDVRFVLETSEGWFARHNIAVGTLIRTERGTLAESFLRDQP